MPAPQIPDIWLETCGWYYLCEIGFLTVAGCSSVWLDSNKNWTCGRFKLCLAIKLDPTVCSSSPVVIRVNASHFSCQHAIDYGYLYHSIIKHNPWRMTVNADEDDYRTGCRNVTHCQQQQSYSGLRSPGRSNSTFFWRVSLSTAICCDTLILLFFFFPTSCSLTLENTLYAIKHWFEVKHRLFVLDIINFFILYVEIRRNEVPRLQVCHEEESRADKQKPLPLSSWS